jgi:hypothetical protein
MVGVRFELAAQLEDMDVDSPVEAVEILTERFIDNLGATENTARLFDKGPQQFKLDGRKI